MNTPIRKIRTAMVPIGPDSSGLTALKIANAIAEEVILVGVVCFPEGESISTGASLAPQIRKRLISLRDKSVKSRTNVIISSTPWKDIQDLITSDKPDLFIIEWGEGKGSSGISVSDVLSNSLCNTAIVRGAEAVKFDRTLIAMRGGPHAELALQVGMGLKSSHLDVLHLSLKGAAEDAAFKGIRSILRHLPEVNYRSVVTEDISRDIFKEAESI